MLIYAHRGASWNYPELTQAAYLAAVSEGADGFECDLRLSRDEVPVLWHNPSMQEIAGKPGLIAEMNFKEILAIYPQALNLDQFLDIALLHKKHVLLETKHPVISGNRIEEIIVKTLQDRKIMDSIEVSMLSFSWSAIEKLGRIDSDISRTYLLSSYSLWTQARFSSADFLGPGINRIRKDPGIVEKIHNYGKKVAVWTVDDGVDVELCRDLGVDILITNKPAHARTFL
jgi:glycerophosphoryl diester phosphodiesterase